MSTQDEHFEVVVAGGGPGGSTLATLVALQGHRVLLLEKEHFPRYQIGESLLPATIHGICKLLGVDEEIHRAGFTRKLGGTFRWGSNPEPWTFSFAASPRFPGPTSYAYQVERSKFDSLLIDNARRKGVEVREGCSAIDVLTDELRVTGVRYRNGGTSHDVRARMVVDATGNRSRLYRHVGGTRTYSDFFRNVAVFGYFENGARLPEPRSGNIFCPAFDGGWFWYIPLSDTMTSVGAVVDHAGVARIQADPEQALLDFIGECAPIKNLLADAHRIDAGPYGQVRVRKDYSYCNSSFSRPGMLLIGDAACFVDPVFSSGVHLATYSGLLGARTVNTVLAGQIDEAAAAEEFERRYRREYANFYEFLTAFYDLHADELSYFWEAKKITQCRTSDLEAFIDLIGGASSGEAALTRQMVARNRLRDSSRDLCESLAGANHDVEAAGNQKSGILRSVMREGASLQELAAFGVDEFEEPCFPGGLIASSDGLRWVRPASDGT